MRSINVNTLSSDCSTAIRSVRSDDAIADDTLACPLPFSVIMPIQLLVSLLDTLSGARKRLSQFLFPRFILASLLSQPPLSHNRGRCVIAVDAHFRHLVRSRAFEFGASADELDFINASLTRRGDVPLAPRVRDDVAAP